MKRNRSIKRPRRGFTLIDTSLGIALMGAMVVPILGLLTLGTVEAGKSRSKRESGRLRDELRLRLQDKSWPAAAGGGREWQAEIEFDRQGRLIEGREARPWTKVTLEGMAAPGFDSERFEAVKVRITSAKTERLLDETVIQRTRKPRS